MQEICTVWTTYCGIFLTYDLAGLGSREVIEVFLLVARCIKERLVIRCATFRIAASWENTTWSSASSRCPGRCKLSRGFVLVTISCSGTLSSKPLSSTTNYNVRSLLLPTQAVFIEHYTLEMPLQLSTYSLLIISYWIACYFKLKKERLLLCSEKRK